MPIYEYQCQQCGHHHEVLQKISDPLLRQCPECGRKSLKRLVSAVRFRLAGSGWYETDFKSDKEAKRNLHDRGGDREEAKAEDKSTPDAAAKTDGKEAAKPAAAAEASAPSRSESPGGARRTMVTKPAIAPARSKPNGGSKPRRRAPASRSRRR